MKHEKGRLRQRGKLAEREAGVKRYFPQKQQNPKSRFAIYF